MVHKMYVCFITLASDVKDPVYLFQCEIMTHNHLIISTNIKNDMACMNSWGSRDVKLGPLP